MKIKIGSHSIGTGSPCFIIAEAGSNHDGRWSRARNLVDIAAESGCQAVKFQLFLADKLYPKDHPAHKILKTLEFPRDWYPKLHSYAKRQGIMLLATPFDSDAVDLLVQCKTPAIKWASSETTKQALLRYAAIQKLPMLISTAMCDLADVFEAVELVRSANNEQIALFHCVALYPTPAEKVNLRMMDTLRHSFPFPVGFSDHTLGPLFPAVAVARGASLIEKHFTVSRKLKGPDHSYALEPNELKLMVQHIRDVENSLGSAYKIMLPEEAKYARRESLIPQASISKNQPLRAQLLKAERPGYGIRPRYLEAVLRHTAQKNIKKGEPLQWTDLEIHHE